MSKCRNRHVVSEQLHCEACGMVNSTLNIRVSPMIGSQDLIYNLDYTKFFWID